MFKRMLVCFPAVNVNEAGVYGFEMPGENVNVSFTADYTPLNIYVKIGSDALIDAYIK